jgi:hypothetical protein
MSMVRGTIQRVKIFMTVGSNTYRWTIVASCVGSRSADRKYGPEWIERFLTKR